MRKVPEWKKSKETTMWYDVRRKKLVPLPADERMMDNQTIKERQVTLRILRESDFIGMNIRGGNEYGLGIYVSRLDAGGLADKYGVCLGDQIVAVNKQSFENVNHTTAVEFLRAHSSLQLTLKGVGRFPAYKEVYQEYTWSDSIVEPVGPDTRLNVNETKINSLYTLSPTPQRNHYTQNPNLHHGQHRLSVQKEILLPRKQDVTYSSLYEDAWTSSGFGDEEHNISSEMNNGRHFQRSDLETSESDSGQEDYIAFLENRRKQEKEKMYASEMTLPQRRHHDEMRTSFGSTPLLTNHEDFTLQTYIRPDQHKTLHQSTPDIQATHTFEEYAPIHSAPIHRRPKSSNNSSNSGIIYVGNHEQRPRTNDGFHYATVQKSSRKPVDKPNRNYKSMSKSQPSLVPEERGVNTRVSAYDDFHMYNRSARFTEQLQEPEIDYTDGESVAVPHGDSSDSAEDNHTSHVYAQVNDRKQDVDVVDVLEHANLSDEEDERENIDNRIELLEYRKMNLGSCEINRISDSKSNGGSSGTSSKKNPHNGTWATIKNKLKGPEKAEKQKRKTKERNEAPMSISKKRGMFELNFGSQVMKQQSVDNYNMMMMEEHARSLLRKDECSAVIRHVKNYHEQKHLDVLIDTLLQILDNSEKLQLLKDIRGVIYPYHVALFDNKVHKYNIKEYERMPTKLHLPLKHDHQRSTKPHKHLMTTVIDEDGHFQIKTMEQHNRDVDHEKAVIKAMRSSLEVETDSEDGGEQTNYNLTRVSTQF